jgi:hypothetical protein
MRSTATAGRIYHVHNLQNVFGRAGRSQSVLERSFGVTVTLALSELHPSQVKEKIDAHAHRLSQNGIAQLQEINIYFQLFT